jgi:hypothetical protein
MSMLDSLGGSNRKLLLGGGVGAAVLLALYMRSHAGGGSGATTATTTGTGTTADTSTSDMAQYVDQQIGGEQLQIGNVITSLEQLQGQVNGQGNTLSWVGTQLNRQTTDIKGLQKKTAAPSKVVVPSKGLVK